MSGEVHKLKRESDTMPPPPGEPPRVCEALATTNIELGTLREHMEWQTECLQLIARALKVPLPPPPKRRTR